MLKKIGIGVIAFIAIALIVVQIQPSSFHVERTAEIAAPPDVVFELVNDLGKFKSWSPWEDMDSSMTHTLSKQTAGVGASFEWKGNDQVGHGKMTITESEAPSKLRLKLDFFAPNPSEAAGGFDIKATDKGSSVKWFVGGKKNFMAKAFGMVMSFDDIIGATYEKGLAKLGKVAVARLEEKKKAEAEAKMKAEAEAKMKAEAEATAGEAAP